jgi:2-polyprenyl-3-methyl-5-hydroxy-6-metoxy-1,4-benzoquinol methylase
MSDGSLRAHRLEAALATKGTSADPIYHTALSAAMTFDLGGDVLEFGAGTGSLVTRLLASGFTGRIICADILARPAGIPAGVDWIQTDLNEPLPVRDCAFDAIISTEVIEHLESPRAVFREFHRLLRSGGRLLLTTPNQESIRSLAALILRGHFVAFLDGSYPAHITALLRADFERICAEAGFEAPRFGYTGSGGIPKIPSLCWQRVSFGLLKGRLFSDNLVVLTKKV